MMSLQKELKTCVYPAIYGLGLLVWFCVGTSYGQCCGPVTTPVTFIPSQISMTANFPPVITSTNQPTFRVEFGTEFREEELTSFQQVWDTEIRERRVTTFQQVPETSVRVEANRVLRPVWVTEHHDTSYNVVRNVPETSEREERVTVSRPVIETMQREVTQTVLRPVQQTVLQQRQFTVNRPVTTFQTQIVDQGQFVNFTTIQPGRTHNRLAWQPGGTFVDPVTGATRSRWPGLYWTPMRSDPTLVQQTVFQPNLVAQQVPVTTMMPEIVTEQVPVTQTTFQQELVSRIEPVQVQRMVQEEVVRRVPVTTVRQVVERVQQTTPVQVMRMEVQEVQREIPVTTFRTVAVERVEQYEVRVPRIVPVTQRVMRPVTVERRTPIDAFGNPIVVSEISTPPISTLSPASAPRPTPASNIPWSAPADQKDIDPASTKPALPQTDGGERKKGIDLSPY